MGKFEVNFVYCHTIPICCILHISICSAVTSFVCNIISDGVCVILIVMGCV